MKVSRRCNRSRAKRDHAMRAFPAQHFLPGPGDHIQLVPRNVHREDGRGGVADGESGPVRGDPVAVGNPHAGSGSVPGEDDVVRPVHLVQIGELAVIGLEDAQVFQLELVLAVAGPAAAKTLPCQDVHAAFAEQRPERHFDRARVGGGNDSEYVRRGNAQHFFAALDDFRQLVLADFGAVRPARAPHL